MQLFRLTLCFLSQSSQLFQAQRNGKRSTPSFIIKGCVIPTDCPFSNLKETDVCNSVSNCSAFLCASPFCALPGCTSPPCWLSASREKIPGWASPIILCLATECWESPAQSWPHRPAAAPGHTWELPALLHSDSSKCVLFQQRCTDKQRGKTPRLGVSHSKHGNTLVQPTQQSLKATWGIFSSIHLRTSQIFPVQSKNKLTPRD